MQQQYCPDVWKLFFGLLGVTLQIFMCGRGSIDSDPEHAVLLVVAVCAGFVCTAQEVNRQDTLYVNTEPAVQCRLPTRVATI